MKAIALYSGGLDSTLAVALMIRLGIEVLPVVYTSPFGDKNGHEGWLNKAENVKKQFDLELKLVPFDEDLIGLVKQPHFGWGKNLNPCIDCHLTMIKRTKKLLNEWDAKFVVTGEVMGQRPMSQTKQALELIDRKCELHGLLVRPLSAQCLEPTVPEQEGWIDRSKLLGLSGRSRKPQLALAKEWGLEYYNSPAGGCLLTEELFAKKIKNLLDSNMLNIENSWWIQAGRYFSLSESCKLIVARNQNECRRLEAMVQEGDLLLRPAHIAGPTAVLRGKNVRNYLDKAKQIVTYYTKSDEDFELLVCDNTSNDLIVKSSGKMDESELRSLIVS